jgi:hypothetical protein
MPIKKKNGRPKIDANEKKIPYSVPLPQTDINDIIRLADYYNVTPSAFLRQIIQASLSKYRAAETKRKNLETLNKNKEILEKVKNMSEENAI